MEAGIKTNRFAVGTVAASALLFLAYVLLGTPLVAILPAILLLGWSIARYAPDSQRVRFAFLGLISVGLAGIVVPTYVLYSNWTSSVNSTILLMAAVIGSLTVLWASVETTNRLATTA